MNALLKKIVDYLKAKTGNKDNKLITNNTGVSVKSWQIYVIVLSSIFMFFVIAFSIIYDTLYDGTLDINVGDVGLYITALGAVIAAAGYPKAAGEKNERKDKDDANR